MNEIIVKELTKDYGHGRGVYDVSFDVKKGEVFGFLGPNGAGKSTTMRHLMGFSKPQKGRVIINNLNCWSTHNEVMKNVGYLPGEVTLPEGLNASEFIEMMKKLKHCENDDYIKYLLEIFQLDINHDIKSMSIGEKRKLAIIAAFMNDPGVLLLDEPTSGLDPVMQEVFIEFIQSEKKKGKTVLLSSHIFNEVEALCDRIAIIKDGKLVSVITASEIVEYKRKTFEVIFKNKQSYQKFKNTEKIEIRDEQEKELSLLISLEDSNQLIRTLKKYEIKSLLEKPQTLESYFMHFYQTNRKFGGIEKYAKHNKS